MENDFDEVLSDFIEAPLEKKIKIFTTNDNLTLEQFNQLLKYYPIKSMDKLIKAVLRN